MTQIYALNSIFGGHLPWEGEHGLSDWWYTEEQTHTDEQAHRAARKGVRHWLWEPARRGFTGGILHGAAGNLKGDDPPFATASLIEQQDPRRWKHFIQEILRFRRRYPDFRIIMYHGFRPTDEPTLEQKAHSRVPTADDRKLIEREIHKWGSAVDGHGWDAASKHPSAYVQYSRSACRNMDYLSYCELCPPWAEDFGSLENNKYAAGIRNYQRTITSSRWVEHPDNWHSLWGNPKWIPRDAAGTTEHIVYLDHTRDYTPWEQQEQRAVSLAMRGWVPCATHHQTFSVRKFRRLLRWERMKERMR